MKELNLYFSKELRSKLKTRYGKVPSCSVIARDFSLLAKNTSPVSIETVRKWLIGECLPHISRLQVLQAWLGLNINPTEITEVVISQNTLSKSRNPKMIQLIKDIEALSEESQELISQLIRTIKEKESK